MSAPLVLLDGELMPLSEARIPLNDRSFLFGDSLYEVIATWEGKPFFSDDHLTRLRATAHGMHLEMPWSDDWFKANIRKGLDAMPLNEVYVRIIVSRGSGDFNIDIDSTETPPMAVFVFKPLPQPDARFREVGFKLAVAETRRNHPRSLNPAFKTGNYLNNILCLHEAKAKGADDALILDLDGHVTELTTSNFGMIKNGELWTAPLDVGILEGITRKHLLQLAREQGLSVHETRFDLDAVYAADEVFVMSTIKGAMPVCQVDDHTFKPGYGPITQQLDQAYWAYVRQHLDQY